MDDPFCAALPEQLRRWPRRTRCRYFSLPLAGAAVRTRAGHWLDPLATVLNTCYHDPHVLAALASGVEAPISNQGMVLAELAADRSELEARRVSTWEARTGAALVGPVMLASPAWLHDSNYVPREDVMRLLATMVRVFRETRFPWLFSPWPCALAPAEGEEALVRALEARAARRDDALWLECEALGISAGHAVEAQRRVVMGWGLPRVVALIEAVRERVALINDRERWDEVKWSVRSMAPPVSLRWYIDGVAPPEGLSGPRWLGACEAMWQRVAVRSSEAGARGEWVVNVRGRRVALAWAVELGTPMLTGWRPADDGEPETPTLAEVDRAREAAAYDESCQLFARVSALRERPTARDLVYLAWLERAWAEFEGDAQIDGDRRARRSLLLELCDGVGLFAVGRDALRDVLVAGGHHRLCALQAAASLLRSYLKSDERRAIVGVGPFGQVDGAWVSPMWFVQAVVRGREDRLVFTARCEAALHGVVLGPAWEGRVRAEIDGAPRELRWRRDIGLVPALCEIE